MGESPNGFSLDRTNVDGNYEPQNCRWANRRVQSHNVRKEYAIPNMVRSSIQ